MRLGSGDHVDLSLWDPHGIYIKFDFILLHYNFFREQLWASHSAPLARLSAVNTSRWVPGVVVEIATLSLCWGEESGYV